MSETESEQRRTIVVLSGDLFFGMRIRTTLRGMDYASVLTKNAEEFAGKLLSNEIPVVLGLVDFNKTVDWPTLTAAIASEVPIIAFGAHTDVEGFRTARAAGVARVISNGGFSNSLPELIAKYAKAAG